MFFLFDQSSGHTAFSDDALNVNHMNVRPGGAQAILAMAGDKKWFSVMAHLHVNEWNVLEESGVNTKGIKTEKCEKFCVRCQASSNEKTKVEKLSSCDHQAIFLPKFHCELNPIECCWCHSKCYTRSHCDYTFPGQLATINNSLDSVTLDMIRKFFRKTRETMRAHCEGLKPGPEMTKALKTYKVIVEV